MPKTPSFQMYPNDWENDSVVWCEIASQGLWLRMMFIMHRSSRYGYLCDGIGEPLMPEYIARKCGVSLDQYLLLLADLERAGVPSRNKRGVIYSRRMLKDEERRSQWRKSQNNTRKNKEVTDTKQQSKVFVNTESTRGQHSLLLQSTYTKQDQKINTIIEAIEIPEWFPESVWAAYVEMRAKSKHPVTGRAKIIAIKKLQQLRERGQDPTEVLEHNILHSYRGIWGLPEERKLNTIKPYSNPSAYVGQGPSGGMRVKPEALERIRKREGGGT